MHVSGNHYKQVTPDSDDASAQWESHFRCGPWGYIRTLRAQVGGYLASCCYGEYTKPRHG